MPLLKSSPDCCRQLEAPDVIVVGLLPCSSCNSTIITITHTTLKVPSHLVLVTLVLSPLSPY
jgi:hypothetical protein